MQVSSHLFPPEPPCRITSRSGEVAPAYHEIAIFNLVQPTVSLVNSSHPFCKKDGHAQPQNSRTSGKAANARRLAGLAGQPRIDFGQHDAPLEQWRADRPKGARRDHDGSIRTSASDAHQVSAAPTPPLTPCRCADTLTHGGLLAAVTQIPDWTCPGCGKTYADPADVPTTCPECGEYADTDVDTLTLGTLIALAEAAWGDGR